VDNDDSDDESSSIMTRSGESSTIVMTHDDEACAIITHGGEASTLITHGDEECARGAHGDEASTIITHGGEASTIITHGDEACIRVAHNNGDAKTSQCSVASIPGIQGGQRNTDPFVVSSQDLSSIESPELILSTERSSDACSLVSSDCVQSLSHSSSLVSSDCLQSLSHQAHLLQQSADKTLQTTALIFCTVCKDPKIVSLRKHLLSLRCE
jgi:hypothetical protein